MLSNTETASSSVIIILLCIVLNNQVHGDQVTALEFFLLNEEEFHAFSKRFYTY